ncbi:hypothetical protein ACWD64_15210 [Streptomyces antibioticus]
MPADEAVQRPAVPLRGHLGVDQFDPAGRAHQHAVRTAGQQRPWPGGESAPAGHRGPYRLPHRARGPHAGRQRPPPLVDLVGTAVDHGVPLVGVGR